MDGRLPVVVEVSTVIDSEAKEVNSWLTLEEVSVARVALRDLTRLELLDFSLASHAGHGRLLKRELVSELELLLSLVPVELPNFLLNLMTLKTSTLSDSNRESWLKASGSSSRPTGVTLEGLPRPGGSYGFTTAERFK